MSRVMHWAQNGSIDHYVTNDVRQLVFPPCPEFVILQFYLLMQSDLFALIGAADRVEERTPGALAAADAKHAFQPFYRGTGQG